MTRRSTPEFNKARKELFSNGPMTCVLCHKAPATDADHIIPFDAGGPDDITNLRPVCKPCNSRAGARYVNAKRAHQQERRAEAMGTEKNTNSETFFVNENLLPDRKSVV
jgi:5-methylcytosine-specific restriction endonuclease McrA